MKTRITSLLITILIFLSSCSDLPKAKIESIELIDSVKIENLQTGKRILREQRGKNYSYNYVFKLTLSRNGVVKTQEVTWHRRSLGVEPGDSIRVSLRGSE